jgi:predicted Rossmann fold flavoprotein
MQKIDVVIIGAGAAGLMCAIEAGKRHRKVLVLDHANKAGKKILMSGGGRCNFTNYHVTHENFISHNPHFCKSALHRYTPSDFIQLVKKHHIPFHEKAHGQLFCDQKSSDILNMLLSECETHHVNIQLDTPIESILSKNNHYIVKTNRGDFQCESLVIASGGLSIPTMGASPFGYKIAEQFGLKVWPTRAGLVPLTLQPDDKEKFSMLSGVALDSIIRSPRKEFREHMLFTHRGLSGPAILQISSYWEFGEPLTINLLPDLPLFELLKKAQENNPQQLLKTFLFQYFPKRVAETLFLNNLFFEKPLKSLSPANCLNITEYLTHFTIKPNGTEGYRTAEVTLGGVDCNAISSKTMEVNDVPGLHFIGEVLDVTGWLGGFNFQWAWSSGWAAGQVV